MYRWVLPAVLLLLVGVATSGVPVDSDRMSIAEEVERGTSPFDADTDGDGLNDSRELQIGASPTSSDSDDDSVPDSTEYRSELEPTDADSDGDSLSDGREFRVGTKPLVQDTDGDGLDDGQEVFEYETNHLVADSDRDGLRDGREIRMGTDPLESDIDNDGLTDGSEVRQYDTSPRIRDSDEDRLVDGMEVQVQGTNPTEKDTDRDMVIDGEELRIDTNPLGADTDGDGLSDGAELYANGPVQQGNPLRKDIFLEVSYADGTDGLPKEARRNLTRTFRDAPVENPNNETGIAVHFLVDEEPTSAKKNVSLDAFWNGGLDDQAHDYQGRGVYHVFIAEQTVVGNNTLFGGYSSGDDSIIVTEGNKSVVTGTRTMHELGHMFGIERRNGAVVDASTPPSTYPSVMNYNVVENEYRFANGTESDRSVDDWGIIGVFANPPERSNITTTKGQ